MTIDELRMFPNCGHYTDEEAENIIRTLEKIASISFDYQYQKEEGFRRIVENYQKRQDEIEELEI